MDVDYENIIKSIFDQRKIINDKINKKTPSLKSITSLQSEENMGTTVKGSLIGNKKEEENNNDFEELKIINIDNIKNSDEEIRLANKLNNNQIDLNENLLSSKLQSNCKVTKDEHFELNISNSNFEKNNNKEIIMNDNIILNQLKNSYQNFSNENKNISNLYNKSNSILKQIEQQKRNKKSFKKNLSKLKDEIEVKKNISNKLNKYEQYNTETLAYEALKNYSHCKTKEKKFLKRMEFYSVKKQTEEKIIDLMVDKAKRKIPEKEKLIIFNRLIEDSNRRAEAKNRIELVNHNNQLANKLYNNDSERKKIKFDQRKFEDNYKEKIVTKLKEKEKKLELLRSQKIKEQKDKEDKLVNEMKKRNRKATQNEIDSISKRLYNKAKNRKLKREMLHSFSELERRLNTISNTNRHTRNYSSFFFRPQIKTERNNNSKNYNNHSYFNNNNNSINTKEIHSIDNQSFSYKYKIENKIKKNNTKNNSNSLYKNMKYYSYINKQYIPYYNAEKVIDEFFYK